MHMAPHRWRRGERRNWFWECARESHVFEESESGAHHEPWFFLSLKNVCWRGEFGASRRICNRGAKRRVFRESEVQWPVENGPPRAVTMSQERSMTPKVAFELQRPFCRMVDKSMPSSHGKNIETASQKNHFVATRKPPGPNKVYNCNSHCS